MGLLDRAKAALGLGGGERAGKDADDRSSPTKPGRKGGRPPANLPPASPSASIEDALVAREAGGRDEARAILRAIDRGKGLRTVLRAAAALEAEDEAELAELLPAIASSEVPWRLALQVASALDEPSDGGVRAPLVAFARARGAPVWALAWADASQLPSRVALLFADAPLARTIAAREWKVPGAADDHDAIERYATFAHGRDAIRRFGARLVRDVVARAMPGAGG
jgi:hypothetical protein